MLKLLAKLFGAKEPAPAQPEAPYKVETPAPVVDLADIAVAQQPAPKAEKPAKKPAAKKPAAPKKAGGRKPKSKA